MLLRGVRDPNIIDVVDLPPLFHERVQPIPSQLCSFVSQVLVVCHVSPSPTPTRP